MNQPTRGFWAAAMAVILLVACGGDDAPLPTIGPAGGTVTGPNGATIVIPPGALAQEVALQITEISAASATLPAGAERVSAVYALTPHGTAFAVPVTVTIPFDPTLVPAGRSVQILKTTDATLAVWADVAGATVAGNSISAEVSSFSLQFAALRPALPTISASQPADLSVVDGDPAVFSVTAQANNGGALGYQWYSASGPIPGEVQATYTIANTDRATHNGAQFSVTVDNGFATVTSRTATLTVNTAGSAGTSAWANVGSAPVVPTAAGQLVRSGGLAVAKNGNVAVSYLIRKSVNGVQAWEPWVSEWNNSAWSHLGAGPLVPARGASPTPGDPLPTTALSMGMRSIVYDGQNRPVVVWLDRLTRDVFVRRWNGNGWEELANPLAPYSAGAVTGDPQIAVDPVSDRPIVVIGSGPNITVRDWTGGSSWSPVGPSATGLGGGILTIPSGGQRLMAIAYGDNVAGTQLLARLYTPDVFGRYVNEVGPPIVATAIGANQFHIDLDTDGNSPFALIGERSGGSLLVRRLSNGAWNSVTGDLQGRADFSLGFLQFRLTPWPSALPVVAYMEPHVDNTVLPILNSRRVGGFWWDGTTWQKVPYANDSTKEYAAGFAFGLDPRTGVPYVALALDRSSPIPTTLPSFGQELVVRRFQPVTLSVNVNGATGSGAVTGSGQTCTAGTRCDVPLPAGTQVTLNAVPANGFSLQSWTGCDFVVALQCTVKVNGNQAVTATFQ